MRRTSPVAAAVPETESSRIQFSAIFSLKYSSKRIWKALGMQAVHLLHYYEIVFFSILHNHELIEKMDNQLKRQKRRTKSERNENNIQADSSIHFDSVSRVNARK